MAPNHLFGWTVYRCEWNPVFEVNQSISLSGVDTFNLHCFHFDFWILIVDFHSVLNFWRSANAIILRTMQNRKNFLPTTLEHPWEFWKLLHLFGVVRSMIFQNSKRDSKYSKRLPILCFSSWKMRLMMEQLNACSRYSVKSSTEVGINKDLQRNWENMLKSWNETMIFIFFFGRWSAFSVFSGLSVCLEWIWITGKKCIEWFVHYWNRAIHTSPHNRFPNCGRTNPEWELTGVNMKTLSYRKVYWAGATAVDTFFSDFSFCVCHALVRSHTYSHLHFSCDFHDVCAFH